MKRCILLLLCLFSFQSLKGDHQVIVCENSIEMLSWAKEFIGVAEQSVEFAPCFFGGDLLHEMLDIIEKQMKTHRRLRVNLLMSMTFLEPPDLPLLNRLIREYPRQFHVSYTTSVVSLSTDLVAIDNHVKMLVVDETYYVAGGTNYDYAICSEGTATPSKRIKDCMIGSKLSSGGRDQDIAGKGAIARELREDFYKLSALWDEYQETKHLQSVDPDDYLESSRFWEIDPLRRPFLPRFETSDEVVTIADEQIKRILSCPQEKPNKITAEYCRLIDGAESEIWIGNLHYSPVDSIRDALLRAVKRGVKVHVITNGVHENSPESTCYMSMSNRLYYLPTFYGKTYSLFEKWKCKKDPIYPSEIYEYDVFDVLYHKKVMVVDEKIFLIGSYNLGTRSDESDYELVLVIESEQIAKKAKGVLKRDIQFSRSVTPDQARNWYFDPVTAFLGEVQRKVNNFF